MLFTPTIFSQLLQPLDRGGFAKIVERHDADAYVKSFGSWEHLLSLIYAQLSGANSLRGLEEAWNAHANAHYHLNCEEISRSTMSDANARRPTQVFAEAYENLAKLTNRALRGEAKLFLRLIDSTPIPLGKLFNWAKSNGRIRGMKAHVVYDPDCDLPRVLDITHANVNDAQVGATVEAAPGLTYVFDKGYCRYEWWTRIHEAQAFFVTRPKSNMKMAATASRSLDQVRGDGFTVLCDEEVVFSSKGDSKLAMPLRRIKVLRDEDGKTISVISNDMTRTAVEIAQCYKFRWQIELLFRWLKQHLKLRSFLGRNENAIKLQIYAAMIAYVLLRLAAAATKIKFDVLRMTELVREFLFARRRLGAINVPPPVNLCRARDRSHPGQLELFHA